MERQPFSPGDRKLTFGILILIAACAAYVRFEYSNAFPQASLNLKLTRAAITEAAGAFLRGRALATDGFRQLTVFDPHDEARLYLERELGLDRANELMARDVAVWRWRARWFRPPDKEELLVWLATDGRITGFEHVIEEAAPGARPSREEALKIAETFLTGFVAQPGRLVEDRLEQRPNRNDHLFTWEQEGFRAKEATYRRTVVVQGDQIGRYQEFLYIPEAWRREFAGMRSRNELYAGIAQAFWAPLLIAALALVVIGLRRRRIPWFPLVAISGAVGALQIASNLNAIPLLVDGFPTSSPYFQTLVLILLQSLGAGVAVFFYVIIAGAAGEPLYRERTGDALSLRTALTLRGASTRQFYRAVWVGYGLTAAHLAFLVAFYLLGRRFGAWSPQDVQYSDLLSTPLPWLFPIAIAAMAATSEEFWFRLLAVPLLLKYRRFKWLAIVIPAFVWGFLHANYPQQPAWIRGVEVGLIGVAAGWVMLRFGIVATLVWHYAVDALLIGLNLFDSPAWFYRISAAILSLAILAPLIVSVALYRRHRGFVELAGAEETVPDPVRAMEPPPPPVAAPATPPWNVRWLWAASLAALAAGIFASPHTFGSWIRLRLTSAEAAAIARGQVPDPDRWRTTTDFIPNLDAAEFEYLRRAAGVEAAERAVRERKPVAVWRTRFFRPLEKEEWRVYVDQSGAAIRRDHLLDERAPGARLTLEEARARASAAVKDTGFTLVEGNEQRRDNRTDYTFVFEDPDFRVGEARARLSVELHGDEPSNFRRFLKLPEEWLRDFQKPRLADFALPALLGSAALPLLIIFIRRLASHETVFHWRVYTLAALAALGAALLSQANSWATVMSGYDTSTPEQNYIGQYLIGRGILLLLIAAGMFGAVLALDLFLQAAIGQAALNRPSILQTAAIAVLLGGAGQAGSFIAQSAPGPQRGGSLWSVAGPDLYLPGLRPPAHGILMGVAMVAVIGVFAAAGVRYMRPGRRVLALVLLVVVVALGNSLSLAGFAMSAVPASLMIAAVLLVVRTCGADIVGYMVAAFWLIALPQAYRLIIQPSPFFRWNGIVAGAVALGIGALVIAIARRLPASNVRTPLAE